MILIIFGQYKEVLGFKYLGSLVTYNDCGRDVRVRIAAGNRSYQVSKKI
jgi:hypothetical protein